MQDSENNDWIVLDPLGNIYEIYVNLNLMTTLFSFNHFWIIYLRWNVSKRHIFKSKFHVCRYFFRYENLGEKS